MLREDDLLVYATKGKPHDEVLKKWMVDIARKYVDKKAKELSNEYGFTFNRIAIKDTITRWGSCSSKKNLNFSWRLVNAPIEVFDYVIIHELCHLKEMNHSRRYWDLVEGIMPGYKNSRRWLKENGGTLF